MEYPVHTGISTYLEFDLVFFLSFLSDPFLLFEHNFYTLIKHYI